MRPIQTPDAPITSGHYSQAVVHDGLIFVSGQLPLDPGDLQRPPGDIAQQTERALRNVEAILRAAGGRLESLVQLTIFLSDMGHWREVNDTVARVLGSHKPARAVIPCGTLNRGCQVEITAIAAAE